MQDIAINRTIYTTRPDTARLPVEVAVYDLLEELAISYQRIDHEETATVESCREVEKLLEIKICKNLFLTDSHQNNFFLLMLPGDKRFMAKELARQMNSPRLSFADETYLEKFLSIKPGSVTVLGLMNDTGRRVQLLVDRELLGYEYVGCHPCVNTSSLKLKTNDLFEKFLPYIKHLPMVVEM